MNCRGDKCINGKKNYVITRENYFLTSLLPQICIRALLRLSEGCGLRCGGCISSDEVPGIIRITGIVI